MSCIFIIIKTIKTNKLKPISTFFEVYVFTCKAC